jgi:hypothetical protein
VVQQGSFCDGLLWCGAPITDYKIDLPVLFAAADIKQDLQQSVYLSAGPTNTTSCEQQHCCCSCNVILSSAEKVC